MKFMLISWVQLIKIGLIVIISLPSILRAQSPSNHALFFAVSDYDASSGLVDLKNPIRNVEAVASLLAREYGFETEIVRNPSLIEMEDKLQAYAAQYANGTRDADGQLLIFFSGHGETQMNEGYFLPRDADPDVLRRTALPYGYWRTFIDRMECRHILVAIDACYSVYFDPDREARAGGFRRPGEYSEGQKLLAQHQARKARLFFTSDGKGDQTPDRSDFAKKFQEGLMMPGGPDGILTSSDIFASLKRAFPTPHQGDFGSDEAGSSFLFQRSKRNAGRGRSTQADGTAWEYAQNAHTLAAYQGYLTQFPRGEFRTQAIREIAQLEATQAANQDYADWTLAKQAHTAAAYREYLRLHPGGQFSQLARKNISTLSTPVPETIPAPKRSQTRQVDFGGSSGLTKYELFSLPDKSSRKSGIKSGTQVSILETTQANGRSWTKIQFGSKTGWILSQYLK